MVEGIVFSGPPRGDRKQVFTREPPRAWGRGGEKGWGGIKRPRESSKPRPSVQRGQVRGAAPPGALRE